MAKFIEVDCGHQKTAFLASDHIVSVEPCAESEEAGSEKIDYHAQICMSDGNEWVVVNPIQDILNLINAP